MHAARVVEFDAIGAVDIPDFVRREVRPALAPARTAEFKIQGPVQDIVVMGAPSRDHTETVSVVAQPAGAVVDVDGVDALLGVGDEGGGAEPAVVVEIGRDRLGGERGGEGLILRLEKLADGRFSETLVEKARFGPLQQGVAREL